MGIKKVKNPKIVAPVKNVVNEHSNIGDNPSIIGLPNSNDVNNPINVDSQPMIGSNFPSFPPPNIDISKPIPIPIDILPNVGMPPPIAQGFNTNIYTPPPINGYANTPPPINKLFNHPNTPPPLLNRQYRNSKISKNAKANKDQSPKLTCDAISNTELSN